jgi:polysaccharide pyruvyl transferase WcaK-like protein
MSRLLIWCGKLPDRRVDPLTTLRRNVTGTNVGNMLFQQAVVKSLSLPDHQLASNGYGLKVEDADRINDDCDVLILPLANQFRPNFAERLLSMAATIRKLKVPVVVVGVGCQTDLDYDFTKLQAVHEPVKRFVSAVLDHSSSIGVRGVCTAEYLKSLGFDAVDVIGCPSMFMGGAELKRPTEIETFDRSTRLGVNISAVGKQAQFSTGLDKMGRVIAQSVAAYDDVELVSQQRDSLMALLLGSKHQTRELRGIPPETYRALFDQGRVMAFVDPRTWVEHLAGRDFVFGTRLHGGIAAVLAGTPAHLIAHAARTLELAQFRELAHLAIG